MSTATAPFRFPTYRDPDTGIGWGIPVLPGREIFEEVRDDLGLTDIEQVMARPPWSFEEAMARFDREDWARNVDAETERLAKERQSRAREKGKDRTKKRPTPKRPR